MELIQAIILGIIQGITEFLPVSSSGHLELFRVILGTKIDAASSMIFMVTVHAATALATIVIFRHDIKLILINSVKGNNEERNFSFAIIISMIPAALVGLFFDDLIETLFSGNILLVGSMLIITGVLLLFADRAKKSKTKLTFLGALIIGISQAIAILPGVSRSGATISTSVLLGIDRQEAARFSFLMVVPLIMGKMILDINDLSAMPMFSSSNQLIILAVGFFSAFFTGLWACRFMILLVKRARLKGFAAYCMSIGILASLWAIIS